MNPEILKEIGLSEREIKVYIALLELGTSSVGPIQEKSGVPSSKIYEVLKKLMDKGLVTSIIKAGKKHFQAEDPKKILAIFDEKRKRLNEIIPELEAKQLQAKEIQSVELYEGLPAIRGLFIGLMSKAKKGEFWYGYSPGEKIYDEDIGKFYMWLGKSKVTHEIKDKLLISKRNKKIFEQAFKKSFEGKDKEIVRYRDVFFPGDVGVFRDKIILLNWENKTAVCITSKSLAEQYKKFHNELYENCERVK